MPENRPLQVLVAGISWPVETFIERLLRGLLSAGLRITVASARRPQADWFQYPGFEWLHTPNWDGPVINRMSSLAGSAAGSLLRSIPDVKKFADHQPARASNSAKFAFWNRVLPYAGRRWDVIYFPWNTGAIELLALFDLGVPVVISCRGSQINVAPYNPRRPEMPAGLERTFQQASRVHCVSNDIAHKAIHWGLDPEKAEVIHPAVDTAYFSPGQAASPGQDTFNLISVGTLNWIKGYEYAIMAIRILIEEGVPVQYQILGDGPDRQRLLYTIYDLGLEKQIRLLGRRPPSEVRDRLRGADVLVLASLSEGISNSVLEAMACGKPIVTTDCGGMREAVTDGIHGYVVPVREPAAMARALKSLWEQPPDRCRFGQNGRARAETDFSLQVQISRFRELFYSAARG